MAILGTTDLGDGRYFVVVDHDPTSVATDALEGSIIFSTSTSTHYRKDDDGSTTNVTVFGGTGPQGNQGNIGSTGGSGAQGNQGNQGIIGSSGGLTTFIAEATSTITRALDTFGLATGMTLTPGAGTYTVLWSAEASVDKNSKFAHMRILANAVEIAESERIVGGQSNNIGGFVCMAEVTIGAAQTIEGHWRVDTTSGGPVATMLARQLFLIQQ